MTRFFPITLRPVKSRPNLKQPQNKYRYGKTLLKKPKDKKKKKKKHGRELEKVAQSFQEPGGKTNKIQIKRTTLMHTHTEHLQNL